MVHLSTSALNHIVGQETIPPATIGLAAEKTPPPLPQGGNHLAGGGCVGVPAHIYIYIHIYTYMYKPPSCYSSGARLLCWSSMLNSLYIFIFILGGEPWYRHTPHITGGEGYHDDGWGEGGTRNLEHIWFVLWLVYMVSIGLLIYKLMWHSYVARCG